MVIVSEIFLKIRDVDYFTIRELGVRQGSCKSFRVGIGPTACTSSGWFVDDSLHDRTYPTSSSSTVVPLPGWRAATAPKRCQSTVTVGIAVEREFYTSLSCTALRVNKLKKKGVDNGKKKERHLARRPDIKNE
jgi:hypothetical protein